MALLDVLGQLGGKVKTGLFGEDVTTPGKSLGQAPTSMGGGELYAAPQIEHRPGLLENLRAPEADGLTLQDKLFATGGILQNDSQGANQYLQQRRNQEMQMRNREAKNAALRGAYVNGKFDPATYFQALAESGSPDFDVGELLSYQQSQMPRQSISGGRVITTNPDFTIEIGEELPETRDDILDRERFAEQQRRNEVLEQIALRGIDVREDNAGLARQREGRIASKPEGGASAAPWQRRW